MNTLHETEKLCVSYSIGNNGKQQQTFERKLVQFCITKTSAMIGKTIVKRIIRKLF